MTSTSTSTSTHSFQHIQLVQANRYLHNMMYQLKQKSDLYELGWGSIAKILKDLPNEQQFRVLSNSDRVRSSFNVAAVVVGQKRALEKIEKVVERVQSLAKKINFHQPKSHIASQSEKAESQQKEKPENGMQHVPTANQFIAQIVPSGIGGTEVATAPVLVSPISTLSIQKSVFTLNDSPTSPIPLPPPTTPVLNQVSVIVAASSRQPKVQFQSQAENIGKRLLTIADATAGWSRGDGNGKLNCNRVQPQVAHPKEVLEIDKPKRNNTYPVSTGVSSTASNLHSFPRFEREQRERYRKRERTGEGEKMSAGSLSRFRTPLDKRVTLPPYHRTNSNIRKQIVTPSPLVQAENDKESAVAWLCMEQAYQTHSNRIPTIVSSASDDFQIPTTIGSQSKKTL